MPGSDYTIFLSVTIVTVSDYAILTPKILPCRGQDMSDYTLLPDQSSHVIFNGERDIIEKAKLVASDFRKRT